MATVSATVSPEMRAVVGVAVTTQGLSVGLTEFEAVEAVDVPRTFVAVTLKV